MDQLGTWDDLLTPAQAESFVGRVDEVALFRQSLREARPKKVIFYISGQGGVGKTELLRRYEAIAVACSFKVAETDELQGDIAAVLGRFAAQLETAGCRLRKFTERYNLFRQLKAQIDSDPGAPPALAGAIGRAAVRAGFLLAEEVPFVRGAVHQLDRDTLLSEVDRYLAQKLGGKLEHLDLVRDPVPNLTSLFFEELNQLTPSQSFLFCFDNYEVTRTYLDAWITRIPAYRPSWNVRFVIACRSEPGPVWDPLRRVVQHIRLDEFSPSEAEEFLDRVGVVDVRRRGEIVDLSGRLPVLMAWLAAAEDDARHEISPTKDVVERFLRWVQNPGRRRLALVASLPRRLDLDVLGCLMSDRPCEELEADLDWLQLQPFVVQREDGWHYHDVVRRMMVRYQRARSDEQYRSLQRQLADWYGGKQARLGLADEEEWRNERLQQSALERVYHHVLSAPEKNWFAFLDLFTRSLRDQRFAQNLLMLATDPVWEDELATANKELLRLLAYQLPAVQMGENETAITMLTTLCETAGISESGQAIAFGLRGDAYRLQGKLEQALADYNRAMTVDIKNCAVLAGRGRTYRLMERYDLALANFDRAIALDSKYAWAIAGRGETYRLMERYDLALADFDRAIALDSKYAWALVNRGRIYRLMEKYDLALADFDRAITLKPGYARALAGRGETHRSMGNYDLALVDFDEAISSHFRDWYSYGRAITQRALGNEEAAAIDLRAAIVSATATRTRTPGDGQNGLKLALYYLAEGSLAAANHLYQTAIDAAISEGLIRESIRDLDDYLRLFPTDEIAQQMRERLERYMEERYKTGGGQGS